MLFPIQEITNFLFFKYNIKIKKKFTLQLKTIKAEIDLNTKKETLKEIKFKKKKNLKN